MKAVTTGMFASIGSLPISKYTGRKLSPHSDTVCISSITMCLSVSYFSFVSTFGRKSGGPCSFQDVGDDQALVGEEVIDAEVVFGQGCKGI